MLRALVSLDTPTGDAQASRRFATLYQEMLESSGVCCRAFETEVGVHLVGDWLPGGATSAANDATPDVTLSCHSDTVWPAGEASRRPPTVRDGCLFGPGVYDMKAGLVTAALFFQFLQEGGASTDRHFRIFVSADEEHGSIDARPYMEQAVPADTCALVLEPPLPCGALKVYRKGVGIYTLEIRGRAAHAGAEPERGASAVDELAHQILALHEFRDTDRGVTINIGTVEGGTASNVVADRVTATIDLRFDDPKDGAEIDGKLRSLRQRDSNVLMDLRGGIAFPPMVASERTLREAERYVDVAGQLGLALGTGRSGGGSDGSFLASRGTVTLDGVGVDGAGAHALDEHVRLARFPVRAALLAEIALRIACRSSV